MENFFIVLALFLMAAAGFLAGRAWEHDRIKSSSKDRWNLLDETDQEPEKEYHCTEEAPDFRAEIHDGARVYEETPRMKKMVCRYCGVKWEEAR